MKEAIRSDCSYIEGGNLTSLQHVIEKRLDQLLLWKRSFYVEIINPTWHLNWEKLSWKDLDLKIKQIKAVNLLIKQLIRQRNLVVKLNKEAKKSFLKNQITENAANKTKNFWKLYKAFFTEKGFHHKQKFTLKTKRGVTSSETTIANVFNNYFVNITKSLNIPAWNPENSRNNTDLEKTLEKFKSHPNVRHIKEVTPDTKV